MKGAKQTTLRDEVAVTGVGVHSGRTVTLSLLPADDDAGIVFQRVSADGSIEREVRADVRAVTATEFATVLGDAKGPLCSTAEHLLAALRGLHVDNVVVEIDGPEVPIMDGSAMPFVEALDQAGLTDRASPRRFIEVIKPVRVSIDGAFGELRPYEHGFRVEAEIEFNHPLIGKQDLALDVTPDTFRNEIAWARTFGFMKDVSKLWSAGYALGASLDNTLVISDDRVLNPEGLRFADEFVRHKVLDAIGDLALAGLPLIGAYKTVRGGHKLNNAVLTALMANTAAWRVVEAPVERPRAARGHAELAVGVPAAAYGPDVS
ncbi:UDP-3-O-[3-hydroxymyristoyl] N-acetylglucosamine deacetylase [Pseudolabrys sp. Root1462]|uniref:UDP-3-O-acyl-N-acetylglucosamine deacetylase n=1 Tax=Pseudolabrys sp. Root1462 TaxID=1736466 RepID=UPI0007032642|nr:UDP-3-O-acyl-N-acetylglucosamine deacetylase [Pseudolabrys sp. Root1462]KQY99983.1 UDP-3-O-[3-hydroxymyristoyl] N-acetylglucosamine deacetylase [Pseudolabrys sp. Root1462]